jgi:hypothetical protein
MTSVSHARREVAAVVAARDQRYLDAISIRSPADAFEGASAVCSQHPADLLGASWRFDHPGSWRNVSVRRRRCEHGRGHLGRWIDQDSAMAFAMLEKPGQRKVSLMDSTDSWAGLDSPDPGATAVAKKHPHDLSILHDLSGDSPRGRDPRGGEEQPGDLLSIHRFRRERAGEGPER